MAESFAFNIAEKVLGKLGSLAIQQVSLAWGVENELEKLKSTLTTIQAVLLDAEDQQQKNHQLTDWLGKLKYAFYDAENVLDEFHYEALRSQVVNRGSSTRRKVCNFLSCSNALSFRFEVGYKIKEIRERLDEIAADRSKFNLSILVEDRQVVHTKREMTHSFVRASDVIGRADDKESIVQLLLGPCDGEIVSIIPIVGIGGLGKTTLAKLVYNDERVTKHFDMKMWVCVSDEFELTKLTREIIKSAKSYDDLEFHKYDHLSINQLQTNTRNILDGKKFLLILDDIWNENRAKWMELRNLLLGGANGSKIIVTTRSQIVANIMRTSPTYNLEGLPHKDCLSLFEKWAFQEGEGKRYPELMTIEEEIVKKCEGVPLAIMTLGSLLYLKTDVKDWLHVRDSEIWKFEQKENDILPALRLSYDHLPSYLKQCFAFYSIFPKDFECCNNDLIRLWMAHGLLQSSNENKELEDIGEQYIMELLSRSFLQDANSIGPFPRIKMHDLIHDLALQVAHTEFCSINSENTSRGDNISKSIQHVSFCKKNSYFDKVPSFLLDLDNLHSIFFTFRRLDPTTSKSFDRTCISRFKYLRLLDLRGSSLEVLPTSIGNLKHLRYLDLSWSRRIKELPNSICKLYNLQSLNLEGCYELEELPRDIGNLINLRFLYLTAKKMSTFPKKRSEFLVSLRCLGIGESSNIKSLGEGIQHFTALRTLSIWCCSLESLNLRYLAALETLTIEACHKLDLIDCQDIQGLKFNLRRLWLNDVPRTVALPQCLQGAANTLQSIGIRTCPNLKALPEWLQNLTLLQKLVIINCPELSTLPEGMHHLTALRELKIQDCPKLSIRCKPKTGEDWPKIAHVEEITLDDESDNQSRPQSDDILLSQCEYESLQQEIARLEDDNRVLQDMVASGRSKRDEAGPSGTAGVP